MLVLKNYDIEKIKLYIYIYGWSIRFFCDFYQLILERVEVLSTIVFVKKIIVMFYVCVGLTSSPLNMYT